MTDRSYLTSSDLAMDREAIERSFASHVEYTLARDEFSAKPRDFYFALARSIRDRIADRWNKSLQAGYHSNERRVYYLSLEYLIGRLLDDAMLNLGVTGEARAALADLRIDSTEIAGYEPDAGLGNGGLGRLAACFMDSMATLGVHAFGYGIRYDYGIFRQAIVDGAQVEQPDCWLRYPNPWEVARTEELFTVRFGGRVTARVEGERTSYEWVDTENVMALAYDTPVPGYRNDFVNTLRLWSAKASSEFDFGTFNRGDYVAAIHEKDATENISRVLYPNDQFAQGRELRLRQEYFFVSATLQDAIRRHLTRWPSVKNLHEAAVFQLNDTHPAVAIAEMMRLLVDDHALPWDEAWAITTQAFNYTNHTVLPEALERWAVSLFGRVLPRHLQIVYEVNRRFLDEVRRRFPGDDARLRRVSLIEEGPEQHVQMAHLAIVGSARVNGVSALHSRILREHLFRDFAEMWPNKFCNETNGITPRRWLRKCNAPLSELIASKLGDGWVTDLPQLAKLAPAADDPSFRAAFRAAKLANKERLAAYVQKTMGATLPLRALFDVQVKRIHEYKRQLLPIIHAVHLHQLAARGEKRLPRVVILAGKAAPGYDMAKRIIRLANDVAEDHQRRPANARSDYAPLPAELLGLARRARHPGGGSLRAGVHGRNGGFRHRQHEALAQRRAHDRHPRRRQHRDPGSRRQGEHVRLRDDGGGGRGASGRLRSAGRLPRGPGALGSDRRDRGGGVLPRRLRTSPARGGRALVSRPVLRAGGLPGVRRGTAPRGNSVLGSGPLGADVPCSTSPAWGASRATRRSRGTRAISGVSPFRSKRGHDSGFAR